jgi:hypothetical protein
MRPAPSRSVGQEGFLAAVPLHGYSTAEAAVIALQSLWPPAAAEALLQSAAKCKGGSGLTCQLLYPKFRGSHLS